MLRKLTDWFLRNVVLGAIPLMAELLIRWADGKDTVGSEKNIPELMFMMAMVNLGTADDVEKASSILSETDPAEKALKESLSNWHNILMAGMVFASLFFGGYLFADTAGVDNKLFLSRILLIAWFIAGLFLVLALAAEIFINKTRKADAKNEAST